MTPIWCTRCSPTPRCPSCKRNAEVVARLLRHMPPKLRAAYLVGQSPERQRFWIGALARMTELSGAG